MVVIIYLVLVDNKATVICYFDCWVITPPKKIKIYQLIDFFLFLSLAQAKLVYSTSLSIESNLKIKSKSKVLNK